MYQRINPNAVWRRRLAQWIESPRVQWTVIAVILFNAVILGLEAIPAAMDRYGVMLVILDRICLSVFVVELGLKALAYRGNMLRSGWNVFDVIVVVIALIPASGSMSVLRALRVLRVFRLITAIPALKRVVAAFLHAIPGLGGVAVLMMVVMYVAAVMATKFFGESHPQWFGDLGRSLFTLFQIMTLESWSMGIVRPVMEVNPYAWLFFVPFIICATFAILNLFIGIIVSTIQELDNGKKLEDDTAEQSAPVPPGAHDSKALESTVQRLQDDLEHLRTLLQQQHR
ncbi:MAG: ion transporter [Planctomycetota bacterium]|nr:MAG: ion transporter [Planctomycetota bacterium]